MKTCTKCKIEKDESNFQKRENGKNGLASWCKTCTKIYDDEYHNKNKEKINKRERDYYQKNKKRLKKVRHEYVNKNREKLSKNGKIYYQANKEKVREKQREYIKKNPNKTREMHLKQIYGITSKDYNKILKIQNGVCAICLQPSSSKHQSGKIKNLAIDHDHETGEIRGLLCDNCNRALGMFKDNPQYLENAKKYLQEYELKQNDINKNITIK